MTVGEHLRHRPPEILALYRFLRDRICQLGPVTIDPQGRGIVFQVRARAIGLAPKDRWIDLTLWLKSGADHPRVRKIDDYGPLGRVLHFRIVRKEDLDPALARLLAEAYAVAAQREVTRARARRRPRVSARSANGS
jgi:uncharacterized protein DUF5655